MQDVFSLVVRTLFMYFFILVIFRLMGQREIGKLSVIDLVISIMIAEMASLALEKSTPLIHGVIPIVVLMLIQMTLAYFSLKSKRVRDLVDGTPVPVIKDGHIQIEEMRKNRYNLDDLLTQLREKNIPNVADVELAILEPSGKLNVFTRTEKQAVTREDLNLGLPREGLSLPVILDGRVMDKNLTELGKTRFWLKNRIQEKGFREFKEIFYAGLDRQGNIFIEPRTTHRDK